MINKNIVNTGFYSDYAMTIMNDLKMVTKEQGKCHCLNNSVFRIFAFVPKNEFMLYPQEYSFQHIDSGEVCLVDIERRDGHYYYEYKLEHMNQKKLLHLIAQELKNKVSRKMNKCEFSQKWHRDNFTDRIALFKDHEYLVADLYFVYDFLCNHSKSISKFKSSYPEIYTKIVGIPRDPISTEFIRAANQKMKNLYIEFTKETAKLELLKLPSLYSHTEADRELVARIKEVYADISMKCLQKKVLLRKKLEKDLLQCKIPEKFLVSNNCAI